MLELVVIGCTSLEVYVRVSCYRVYLSGSVVSVCQSELLLSVPLWKRCKCMSE